MPTIEFLLDNGHSAPDQLAKEFAVLFEAIAKAVGVSEESVSKWIISSQARFGEAVKRFDPTGTYTNSSDLVAAGKVFPDRTKRPGPSTVLLLESIACAAHQAAYRTDASTSEKLDAAFGHLYVIFHELGHVKDHAVRPDFEFDGTTRDSAGNRVLEAVLRNGCAYHFDILLSELAATVHSAAAYNDVSREDDVAMNVRVLRNRLVDLRSRASVPEPDLFAIRGHALAVVWFVLIQHAKFVGSQIGNSGLVRRTVGQLWPGITALPEFAGALKRAEGLTAELWSRYPDWRIHELDRMIPVAQQLGEALGYRFLKYGRDGVWWDEFLRERAIDALGKEPCGAASCLRP